MKSFKLCALTVLAFVSVLSIGSLVSPAVASQATVDVPVRVYDLEPMTIVESTPLASNVITLDAITITGSARKAPRSVGSVRASHEATSTEYRLIDLDQGGRPGARSVRAFGNL
jgi:hypothetical protein